MALVITVPLMVSSLRAKGIALSMGNSLLKSYVSIGLYGLMSLLLKGACLPMVDKKCAIHLLKNNTCSGCTYKMNSKDSYCWYYRFPQELNTCEYWKA